jgi:hypothetical protein
VLQFDQTETIGLHAIVQQRTLLLLQLSIQILQPVEPLESCETFLEQTTLVKTQGKVLFLLLNKLLAYLHSGVLTGKFACLTVLLRLCLEGFYTYLLSPIAIFSHTLAVISVRTVNNMLSVS